MDLILFVVIFVVVLAVAQSLLMLLRGRFNPEVGRLRREIKGLSADRAGASGVDIVKKRVLSSIPWLNEALLGHKMPTLSRLERLLAQGDVKQPLGFYLLLSTVLAAGAGFLFFLLSRNLAVSILMAILAAPLPWFYVVVRKKRRLDRFEKQLPDALDMIARALKAGHAFNGGLQMVVMEFADPAKTEFSKTLDEINFGLGYEDALRNMADRVDCPDLKFFALSVIIQRQSGGNLAEILEKISGLIRERFKLHGKVKALTGEARASALILALLPFFMTATIYVLNPSYIEILFREPVGRWMVAGALAMMFIGMIAMKRMVSIKV